MTQRFLITRLSAIGDAILTMPLAVAVRERMPDATIVWAAESAAATLLRDHPCVDDVIVVRKGWMRRPSEWTRLRRVLRRRGIDAALDPQSLTKSGMIAYLSGAPRRIAFAPPIGRELAPRLATERIVPQRTHVVERQLELLEPLGLAPSIPSFRLPKYAAAADRIVEWLDGNRVTSPFIVLNPSAAWPSKRWPPERYAALAERLAKEHDAESVVVWAGEEERRMGEAIVARAPEVCRLACHTSLRELAELVRRAALFVGSDTGPLHLAAAGGTPCVGLYGPTLPEVCGPYGPVHETVQVYYQDGTSRQRRRAENRALRAITVEMAAQACARVWRRASDRTAA